MSLSLILTAMLALQAGTSVLLHWQVPANPSAQVVGYNVYRQDTPSAPWVKINTSLVPSAQDKDETVRRGHSYSYSVRSVDEKGNESAPSQPWSVKVPKKAKKLLQARQARP